MPILNYTTEVKVEKTANEIQEILRKHGAEAVAFEYKDGSVEAISFKVATPQGSLGIRLPVDPDAIYNVLKRQIPGWRQTLYGSHGEQMEKSRRAQSARVAWRIVKRWVEAQMAILETEMVKIEQVFLPYVIVGDRKTLYQAFTEGKLLIPEKGTQDGEFKEVEK